MVNIKIAILDDHFPNPTTGFRIAEFDGLLNRFPKSIIFTTSNLSKDLITLGPGWSDRKRRIKKFGAFKLALGNFDVAYIDFLNNAKKFVPVLDRFRIPYVLTLYPGGGFSLSDAEVRQFIQRMALSGTPKTIITTTNVAKDFMEDFELSNCTRIVHIPGVPIQRIFLDKQGIDRLDYPEKLDDLVKFVFLAHKYTTDGADKGWPQFQHLISKLASEGKSIKATVIGPWGPHDLIDTKYVGLYRFLGELPDYHLPQFLLDQHFIVSINTPNLILPGQFDGFPVASVVAAALCGVVPVVNDPLGLNNFLESYVNSILIDDASPISLINEMAEILLNPRVITSIAKNARQSFASLYNPDVQLIPRYEALEVLAGI